MKTTVSIQPSFYTAAYKNKVWNEIETMQNFLDQWRLQIYYSDPVRSLLDMH